LAGIIMTSLPITFQAAFEESSRRLAQAICLRPSRSRGWGSSGQGGTVSSPHG